MIEEFTSVNRCWLGKSTAMERLRRAVDSKAISRGKYYVKFDQVYKAEIKELVAGGMSEELAKKQAPSLLRRKKCCSNGSKATRKW